MTLEPARGRWLRRCLLFFIGTPVSIVAVGLVFAALGTRSIFPFLGLLLVMFLGAVSLPLFLFGIWRLELERERVRAVRFLVLAAACTAISPFAFIVLEWRITRIGVVRASERAEPMIAAIKAFEKSSGGPPDSLTQLIPAYLPALPSTADLSFPDIEYQRLEGGVSSFLWWDLGSRNGALMSGLWVFSEGDPDHAILGIRIDSGGAVKDARADRLPETNRRMPFSPEAWAAEPENRLHMVQDLVDNHDIAKMNEQQLIELLGAPTGRLAEETPPWELVIPCSTGGINWDVFVYWPTERYPNEMHGGSVERIGRWAYVHE